MKQLACAFQGLLLVCCLWWVFWHVEWHAAFTQWSAVSLPVLCLVFAQRYVPYVMLGIRLKTLFPSEVSAGSGFRASVLCVGCNNILPARLGELVKMVWLHGHNAVPYSTLMCGILFERLLDMTLLLSLVLFFALAHVDPHYITGMAALLMMLWVGILIAARHGARLLALVEQWQFPARLRHLMRQSCTVFATRLTWKAFLPTLVFTLLVWSMNYLHVHLLANELMNLQLPWQAVGLLCVTIFFSGALLLVPGGVGVMEAAVIAVLTLLGIDMARAAATAMWARFFYSLPPLLGAVGVLLTMHTPFMGNIRQLQTGLAHLRQKTRN